MVEPRHINMAIVARGNAGEERACGTRERRRQPPEYAAQAWNRTQPRQRGALLCAGLRVRFAYTALRLKHSASIYAEL
ncbi:hypothetical protein CZ787_12875 [Halomonas citrativorans]|uniref:Uncharacterized protein n=1 Tax=Halomonas citrativorans TaxID=2742612 RepID=A0A1R4I2M8_9GAMM|nr:hypothetical protein CZ787_12875 [Halomonas citrativorans]